MKGRGFTLVELVVALVVVGLVGSMVYRFVLDNTRAYRATTRRIDERQSLRVAATVLPAELRELDATDGDIRAMSLTSVTIRATRQLAFLCDVPRAGGVLAVRDRLVFGTREFNPDTDSLLIYHAADDTGDGWFAARLNGVGAGTCPDGDRARLLTALLPAGAPSFAVGAPVRGFEVVTYRLYKGGDGHWNVGLLDGLAGGIQPLVGPVDPDGLAFAYHDSSGATTTIPEHVATVEIRLRARPESTITVVALRNNRRP